MTRNPRSRFIFMATLGYALLALAWIFFSDQLLSGLVDEHAIIWLSTAKGVFFVVTTSALLFACLQAVPQRPATVPGELGILGEAASSSRASRGLFYLFAMVIPLAVLALRLQLPIDPSQRPLLVMFMFPIILSAVLGGLGPGLLATAMTTLLVSYALMPPLYSLQIDAGHDQLQLLFLLCNGVLISLLSEMSHQAMRRLELNRRLLDSVVSGSSDAIYVKDQAGRYLLINRAAAEVVGQPPEQIIGHDDYAIFPRESAELIRDKDRGVMASDHPLTHEEQITTLDGKELTFLVTKGPVYNRHGQVNGLFGISRDITERKRAEASLRTAQKLAGLGSWEWNLQDDSHYWSEEVYRLYGRDPALPPATYPEVQHYFTETSWSNLSQAVEACMSLGTPYACDAEIIRPDGSHRWICARGQARYDRSGKMVQLHGTVQDITSQKLFELTQREAGAVFDSSYEGIMVVSPQKTILKVNPAFTRITGYSAEEVLGKSPRLLSSGRHGGTFYQAMWRDVRQNGIWHGEIWNRRKNGEIYAEQLSIVVVHDQNGAVQYYIGMFSDISQLKAHEAELNRIAHFDPLTGLPNRRLLADRLEQSIIRAQRSQKSLAVCFLDLDGFKAINDQYGHSAGDQLLVGISDNLKRVLRGDDTLARLGGDEFVLLLSNIQSPEECALILERVLQAVGRPTAVEEVMVSISASIGVSLYPSDHADADTLLRHADQAMYLAKEAGRNRYHLFDPENDRKAQDHRRALEQLRTALERQQFTLYYQPKVDLRDGRVIGAEALVRWLHPECGLVPPLEFLGHLYGSDLEQPFGEWVIETALTQLALWHQCGLPLTISVNISANHLLRENFTSHLAAALARHAPSLARHFELEVLETAAIADMEQAVTILQHCRTLGVHFSLDDFGTGYSSLTYLRKLPVDTLKIDQSFVRDMLKDPEDLGIVESVIRLADAFNRQVIAEGVETLEHGATLLNMGCSQVQGYGIAKPMPAEQLLDWAEQWRSEGLWRTLSR
ncbi:diguanylate cyclase (GGDEF)-like protein/PAS domain S-box-containing protein [Pseudomonas fluvialis]|uniref:Diguanylate cyclase (GGDEF)-like protein/PAS domain S-box-containing protein n=1 Tax=Pseudomonas fluvialis TaxID=1793966 RepID=A0A7X0BRS6_9PSED|nr:EAL domain-containing protein [Pseudomonas fluvialis]MBB6340346.1 diguanylate cyclase (GGDEF)-like protein/PAS domain S-box-containing protein [Pseudomonas fluvialis]